jgi:hypothetical protein
MRFGIFFALAITALPAEAAVVLWQDPVEVSLVSDVLTTGLLHGAMAVSGPIAVNGVNFSSYSKTDSILRGDAFLNTSSSFGLPNLSSNSYNLLLSDTAYAISDVSPVPGIWVGGLTLGNSYTVQIWQSFWDVNWRTSYVAGNASKLVKSAGFVNYGAGTPSRPEFVVGQFVADSATQLISLAGDQYIVMFSAVQVRDLSTMGGVPEPSSWAMLIAGFGLTGAAMRFRSRLVI